jgi:hypothetical protein
MLSVFVNVLGAEIVIVCHLITTAGSVKGAIALKTRSLQIIMCSSRMESCQLFAKASYSAW